jgi:hypothetical protein
MAASISISSTLSSAPPRELFPNAQYRFSTGSSNIGEDGRFLMVKGEMSSRAYELVLVQNWLQDLKRKVPPE